jgi:hypothetical protein
MEAICSSETSVDFHWTTWWCIHENEAPSVRIFFKTKMWVDIHFLRQEFVVAKGTYLSNTQGHVQDRCLLDVMPSSGQKSTL